MMKKACFTTIIAVFGLVLMQSCGENKDTDVVPSGTYTGVAETVEPGEKEIYVRTSDDKLLELYFTDNTKLTKNGETVEFNALSEGVSVEVQVEKKGQKLDPIAVKIME
ncbi:hypothetical protein RQM65_05025 [Pricia sp. S334]|uniref:Uncharacterized protein n=1 Tax=Pricia mediterranea TaxID=3076079 RepID=A0ABU3L2R0_9FLAO|nr:hypothetical protein [Pricia sp. S334]MDT7828025.1 hypothetical protein [Pricia sp. S334]